MNIKPLSKNFVALDQSNDGPIFFLNSHFPKKYQNLRSRHLTIIQPISKKFFFITIFSFDVFNSNYLIKTGGFFWSFVNQFLLNSKHDFQKKLNVLGIWKHLGTWTSEALNFKHTNFNLSFSSQIATFPYLDFANSEGHRIAFEFLTIFYDCVSWQLFFNNLKKKCNQSRQFLNFYSFFKIQGYSEKFSNFYNISFFFTNCVCDCNLTQRSDYCDHRKPLPSPIKIERIELPFSNIPPTSYHPSSSNLVVSFD